jgi:hypothetical protein
MCAGDRRRRGVSGRPGGDAPSDARPAGLAGAGNQNHARDARLMASPPVSEAVDGRSVTVATGDDLCPVGQRKR